MKTINKVILIGNVAREPVVRNTKNDKKVALFSLATNRYYKTTKGENKSEAEFHNCVAWGNLAERVEKSLNKGKLVYIEGRLRNRAINKEDGTKNYKTEVVVSNLIFLNKKSDFDSAASNESNSNVNGVIEEDNKF